MRFHEWQSQLQTGDWFNPPKIEIIRWMQPHTAASAQALWATFPNIA
ncbi:MAG TPA: SAM-dependent methyltransferase, partial [Micromonosporaceae bacterium]|nr:SAM-dependent methyltransferase [Micromonosporaceae bacterium]